MVLHVAGAALGLLGVGLEALLPLELGQDPRVGKADGVGLHVQPPAVGHAQHHVAGAGLGAHLDGLVEHGQQRVQSLDRELLLAQEGLVEVGL